MLILRFPEDNALIKDINSKYGTRRSAKMRSWYVPASEFKPNDFMNLMKGMAWVEYIAHKSSKATEIYTDVSIKIKKKYLRN